MSLDQTPPFLQVPFSEITVMDKREIQKRYPDFSYWELGLPWRRIDCPTSMT